jgi:3-methylfumaryl-CoA hydratase
MLTIDSKRCERFSALLGALPGGDVNSFAFASGILPHLWHWLYTHETPVSAKLGLDGHSETRPFGVPEHFTRRLWASSTIKFFRPIVIGQPVTCTVITGGAELKNGKSGPLAFVPVTIDLCGSQGLLLTEHRIGVYRPMPDFKSAASGTKPEDVETDRQSSVDAPIFNFDELSLFRYSAILGVCHRIHYDYNYATGIEGYSGLVIHGPLLAQALVSYAIQKYALQNVDSVTVRCFSPNVLHVPLKILADYCSKQNQVNVRAKNSIGAVTMSVVIQLI